RRLALWAWRRWWGTAGPVEPARVLLLGLVHHGGAWRTGVTISLLTLLREPCLLSFPLLPQAELCTQDVSTGVWRRLETCLSVSRRPWTCMEGIDRGGHTDTRSLGNQCIRGGADCTLGDQRGQRRPGEAELVRDVGCGASGHGRTSRVLGGQDAHL